MDTELVLYDAARKALALAKNTDEVIHIRDKSIAMSACARVAKDKSMEADAYEIRRRSERRLGELMAEQRETVGMNEGVRGQLKGSTSGGTVIDPPENNLPTLADAGIDKHLADTARKAAAIPEPKFEIQLQKKRKSLTQGPTVANGSGDQENYTPQSVIDNVRKVLGAIDLDPASCETAQRIVKAKRYFTEEDDGLSKPWTGRVFLNPPYQMPQIRNFTDKLIAELPNIESAILLTNNNTDTKWFHKCARAATLICFTAGRIHFYTPDIAETQPTNGQSFFYFGNEPSKFIEVFRSVGFIAGVLHEEE